MKPPWRRHRGSCGAALPRGQHAHALVRITCIMMIRGSLQTVPFEGLAP
jgi:hypothetical protein